MADENPPSDSPESADLPKKETVRITLPPKPSDVPVVKRETVRIQPPGAAPKKDSSRLPGLGGSVPPAAPKPFMPPPVAPKPPGAAPGLPARPAAPAGAMPLPPGAPAPRPAMPGAPAGAPKAATYADTAPVTMKAAAPKKETARISVPPDSKSMPKATIRMQQTQPLSQAPAPALRSTGLPSAASVSEADPMVGVLSWVVLVVSLASAVLGFLAYSA